jgi:hypothetical protein
VNPHSQLQVWLFPQGTADLQSAAHRGFGISKKHQGHAIPGRQTEQLTTLLGAPEFGRIADDLLQPFDQSRLLVHPHLGVRHNVHKQHMGNLQRMG